MLSKLPVDLSKIKQENIDREILRLGIIAEYDAVSLYEQMAEMTNDEEIRAILLDIADEEKEHIGEFQTLLLARDKELGEKMEEGRSEVENLT